MGNGVVVVGSPILVCVCLDCLRVGDELKQVLTDLGDPVNVGPRIDTAADGQQSLSIGPVIITLASCYPPKADAAVGLDLVGWGLHGFGL